MTTDAENEVYRALRESQNRYTYFLLASSGAAIAFAVNQTHDSPLSWSQLPLAGAVLSWGLSFYFGCENLGYVASNLFANLELLKVQSGSHPKVGTHPQMVSAASEGIREAIRSNSDYASRFGNWQFKLLVVGGVLYVVWHVLEMHLRTIHSGVPL